MTKEEIARMKQLAHAYSLKMTGRTVKTPIPRLALAFEAGWRAKQIDKSGHG